MNQMRDLIDENDFAEFFDGNQQQQQTDHHQQKQIEQATSSMKGPMKSVEMVKPSQYQVDHKQQQQQQQQSVDDMPSSPRDEEITKKLKEVDAFMQNYSGVAMPREQIWKNSELLSMEQLLEFDDDQEASQTTQNVQPEVIKTPDPPQQKPKSHFHENLKLPQQKQAKPETGFNSSEALGLLMNIQNTSGDSKFNLIDSFLDKYKIESKPSKSNADNSEILLTPSTAPLSSSRLTANQIFEQIIGNKQKQRTAPEPTVVAPFCVQSKRGNTNRVDMCRMESYNKPVDVMPSYSTYEALQNVEICSPQNVTEEPQSKRLDKMITSNKKDDKHKDTLYWERRRINNEAAYRSRAKRKRLIEEKSERIIYFEQENPKLKQKLDTVLNECAALKRKLAFYERFEFK